MVQPSQHLTHRQQDDKDNRRDSTYGLSAVMQLQSRMFEYKEDDQRTDVGFIAEEVNEVIPELVVIDGEGRPDAVHYDRITSVCLKPSKNSKKNLILPRHA